MRNSYSEVSREMRNINIGERGGREVDGLQGVDWVTDIERFE